MGRERICKKAQPQFDNEFIMQRARVEKPFVNSKLHVESKRFPFSSIHCVRVIFFQIENITERNSNISQRHADRVQALIIRYLFSLTMKP